MMLHMDQFGPRVASIRVFVGLIYIYIYIYIYMHYRRSRGNALHYYQTEKWTEVMFKNKWTEVDWSL